METVPWWIVSRELAHTTKWTQPYIYIYIYISIYIHGPRPGAFGLRDSPMPDSGSPQASLFGAVSKDGS
jgi:hypothetical protein